MDYGINEGVRVVVLGDTNGRMVYARPRCPSKAQGRKCTRRDWKRQNPPGVYWHIVATRPDGSTEEYLA